MMSLSWGLEVAARRLLALDGLEQRFEVALAKAARALTLDDLEEHRRAILLVAGEDLQQIAVVIAIHQDAQLRQFVNRLVNLTDAPLQFIVVGGYAFDELDTLL